MADDQHLLPALFGFIGRSGAGKTTLITDIIDCLRLDGFTVSAIKRAHDGFDMDRPGKDSWRLREAGCREVMMAGDRRWALLHENHNEPEPSPLALARRMAGVDIVLFEGFRNAPIPMIEVFRPSLGRPMLWPDCPSVVAMAVDGEVTCPLPVLELAAPQAVTTFVTAHLGLQANRLSDSTLTTERRPMRPLSSSARLAVRTPQARSGKPSA